MLKVKDSLCCKLETGGLVLGYFFLVSYLLAFVSCIVSIILAAVYSCRDIEEFFRNAQKFNPHAGHMPQDTVKDFQEACGVIKIIFVVIIVIATIANAGFSYMAWCLVKGTQTRDHVRVKPMMILFAILAVLSVLNVLSFSPEAIVLGLVSGIMYGYFFVVTYSLYCLFKEEYERGFTAQYRQAANKA